MVKDILVSIIMPVYNADNYLSSSIESILNQTFCNYEFIIINDGSTDTSLDIIKKFANVDARIVVLNNKQNTGYVQCIETGLRRSKAEFIARMDADDISLPTRLEKQYSFMQNNKAIGVCGTWFKVFGNSDFEVKHPVWHDEIKIKMIGFNCIGHPTVMIRKELLEKYFFDNLYVPCEDYHLWSQLIHITRFHNIPDFLLLYRDHPTNISKEKKITGEENELKIGIMQIGRLGLKPSAEEVFWSKDFIRYNTIRSYNSVEYSEIIKWAIKLISANRQLLIYRRELFEKIISDYIYATYSKVEVKKLFDLVLKIKFIIGYSNLPMQQKIKAFFKSLIMYSNVSFNNSSLL